MVSADGQPSWEALGQEERVSLASASSWEDTAVSPCWAFHCLLGDLFALTCCHLSMKWPAPLHPPKHMNTSVASEHLSIPLRDEGRKGILQGNVLQNSAGEMVS